ncbi:glycerophosphodiester phosphodiesterase [Treponema parvum]|uniref:Glycerophosphodiester phosphodiesterase n=2 Tax=Treponema parvum TaxID=138851 RepID=A0A975IDE1_9SPIR|nr:glycerophosphodiester phosphodiesterase [Treponema parvum]
MRELLEKHRASGSTRPLIGGHRGCECQWPENSIKAMEEGIRQGADYLEIDIQLTKDNIPIVFHDIEVKEKTGLDGYVQDHIYQELKDTFAPPTFMEVMEWGKKNKVYFALEIKSYNCINGEQNLKLMPILDDVVRQYDMYSHVEAFSVDWRALKKLKSINPLFDIGLISPVVPADSIALLNEYDAFIYLSYVWNMRRGDVEYMQKNGIYVSGAILRDMNLIEYAKSIGVDMFEFDKPELLGYIE